MRELIVDTARLELVRGNIVAQDTDAIVNAANSGLRGGGGVDGAIHAAGGAQIMAECRALGGCATGDAKITSGGALRAKFVIHAVGPVFRGGRAGEADLLASAYRRCLQLVVERGLRSVAFPSISTGAYSYPIRAAARVALSAVVGFLRDLDTGAGAGSRGPTIELVRVVLFSAADLAIYEEELAELTARKV